MTNTTTSPPPRYGMLARQEPTMPTPVHELEAQVLSLGPEDRAHLLELLIESFEPDPAIQDAWVAEARTREAEVAAGRVALVPGDEAVARIRAKIS
ncbi:MAG: addiction module protein [Vicinamibacteria bacterium]